MSRELQTINQQSKLTLQAGQMQECRSSGHNVKKWCKENGFCEQTYYRWHKKIFEIAKAQHEVQFAEVTPTKPICSHSVAVTVSLSGVEAVICNGANATAVETVLQFLKLC